MFFIIKNHYLEGKEEYRRFLIAAEEIIRRAWWKLDAYKYGKWNDPYAKHIWKDYFLDLKEGMKNVFEDIDSK